MAASINDKITDAFNTANPNSARVTVTRTAAAASLSCDNLAGWPTATAVHFATYKIDTNSKKIAGTQIDWKGIVSGNTIGTMTRQAGATDAGNAIGDIVEMMPTASWEHDLYTALTQEHNKLDGTHNAITANSLVSTGAVTSGGTLTASAALAGNLATMWNPLTAPFDIVTYNGNRSYTCVKNTTDLTGTLSPGMRLRTTRTVAAPTQSTSLNGTTQYYSKAAPAGMTFTDDFVVSAWVKATSYQAGSIASRYNGTSGWDMRLESSGQISLSGFNAGAANTSYVLSYQSIPLNKWVHVTTQLDMSTFTATPTTSYVMLDGVDVPSSVGRAGTNPTALIQAGNLEIGSRNAGTQFFPGKIAQVAIYSAKVTQATILTSISQTLVGTETSLISAYSFNNVITDLNANANNLTANGSAVATNADSPFGGQAGGTISSTLDYGIIQSVAFSTNTTVVVQVPEGCTIPTSGGVSAVAYSSVKVPYGFPAETEKWDITAILRTDLISGASPSSVYLSFQLSVPIGKFNLSKEGTVSATRAAVSAIGVNDGLSLSTGSIDNTKWATFTYISSSADLYTPVNRTSPVNLAAATNYYWILTPENLGAYTNIAIRGARGDAVISAKNAYL